MRERFHLVFVLCFAAKFILYVDGMFTVSCPMGCTADRCTLGVGCPLGMCMPGWCGKHGGRNVGMMCVPTCSPGQFCLQEPVKMCADCRVRNCKSCTERNKCDTCDRGYTLSSDKSRRRKREDPAYRNSDIQFFIPFISCFLCCGSHGNKNEYDFSNTFSCLDITFYKSRKT